MNIDVIKNEKQIVELHIDNATIAEVLRVYLYKAGVNFAAWRKEHPSKPLLFRIESKDASVKKLVSGAISEINGDCAKIISSLKK